MTKIYLGILILLIMIGGLAWYGKDILDDATSQTASVYFLDDNKFGQIDTEFETKVDRQVAPHTDLKQAVLDEIIKGPSPSESTSGLRTVQNGITKLDLKFNKTTGVAGVFIEGDCQASGSVYTIADLIIKNLQQFSDVKTINIYDDSGAIIDPKNPHPVTIPDCLK